MNKGASATEIIVALALGLIVIVGLGYLVWTWLGKGGGQVSEQYCRAKALVYCQSNYNETFSTKYSDCKGFDWASEIPNSNSAYCRDLLGKS